MKVFAKHRSCGFAIRMGAVVGTICCLQLVLGAPPAFTGTLQDVQKTGEKAVKDTEGAGKKAAEDTQKAGKKAAKDTEKARGKAARDTQKAGEKAAKDTQKAGGKAIRDIKISPKHPFGGKKTKAGPPAENFPGGETNDPGQPDPGSPYSEQTSYPSEQREEPKKAPEFSLGSTESTIQGDDKSVYEKLGISGLALPEGETERGNQGADAPQDEPVQENKAGSRR